jgi:hypothetical protein
MKMFSVYRKLRNLIHDIRRMLTDANIITASSYIHRLKKECSLPGRLEPFGYKVYSQNEEDGILAEIFRRIGVTSRTFVEFGCGDGAVNNTVFLLMQGWRGLWIDGNEANVARARAKWHRQMKAGYLTCKVAFITRNNINDLLSDMDREIDLLSIDIDGNDYHIWEAIDVVCPRVVCIEFNAKFPPPVSWAMPYDDRFVWDGSDHFGASLSALVELSMRKGYSLVGCDLTGVNAFFVRDDLLGGKFAIELTPEALYQPPRYYLSPYLHTGHPAR